MQDVEPERISASIAETARFTGESSWQVYEHLRLGHYQGLKSGRRTLVIWSSVLAHQASLPVYSSAKKKQKRLAGGQFATEAV